MPSHRPVSRFRHVVPVKKQEARDPRFDERSGKYNPAMFKKAYSFVDDIKEKEKKMAERELHKTKNQEKKSQLHKLLQRMVCMYMYELSGMCLQKIILPRDLSGDV